MTGLSEDPLLIRPLPYLKQARAKRSVSARADSLPAEPGAETHAAENRDRPRGGRDELGDPETEQMGRSAHRHRHARPAKQRRSSDHGNTE